MSFVKCIHYKLIKRNHKLFKQTNLLVGLQIKIKSSNKTLANFKLYLKKVKKKERILQIIFSKRNKLSSKSSSKIKNTSKPYKKQTILKDLALNIS